MKICSKCKQNKSEEDFSKNKSSKDGLQHSCKQCKRIENKNHFLKNRNYYKEKQSTRRNLFGPIIRENIYKFLLEHPCVDCGEKDPIVLDFDHQKDKINCVSLLFSTYNWDTILKEIQKCEVRCANCHRRKTAKDFNWFKWERSLIG